MNFVKKHKLKLITVVCIIFVLAGAFFMGDRSKNGVTEPNTAKITENAEKRTASDTSEINTDIAVEQQSIEHKGDSSEAVTAPDKADDTNKNDTADKAYNHQKNENAAPAKQADSSTNNMQESGKNGLFCTLSVRCENAVGKSKEKASVIPADGIIFAEQTVEFYDGESVFNVLSREMKKNKIHLEFVNTPIYSSAYIEGINNLYAFDCGELSGWMYRVNGEFPNYGCSQYKLKNGDKIEWVYTCDLGADVGGRYYENNPAYDDSEK